MPACLLRPSIVGGREVALRGFSIELWNSISARLNRETEYLVVSDVGELLDAVGDGRADLGIAAVSITSEREGRFDFSQPILNAGLQILMRGAAGNAEPSPIHLMRLFFSRTLLIWLGIALLLIMIPAHLVWVVERHHRNEIIPSRNYFPGIFHAMFWAAGTLATQADHMPRHWIARIVAVLWMFTAVVFVAFYTAQLTASLTAQQIRGSINGPQDLVGRHVGTTRASTAAAYLSENKVQVREFATLDAVYDALLEQQVGAVVFDAPAILYYATHDGKGLAQVVGGVFHKEDYGIVFPTDSPLRKQVNEALLALRENGTYQKIYDEWFGRTRRRGSRGSTIRLGRAQCGSMKSGNEIPTEKPATLRARLFVQPTGPRSQQLLWRSSIKALADQQCREGAAEADQQDAQSYCDDQID